MRPRGAGTLRIDVTDEITRDLAATIERALDDYPLHSVEIICDSIGGSWDASVRIFECLAAHDKRVAAFIHKAHSGAALIAMAADHRQIDPCGHFLLHMPRGEATAAQLEAIADAKAALIASRCRMPQQRIRKLMEATTIIDAAQALHLGLATEVPGMKSATTPTVFL
jgi:ATP-dependent protease ClpP protease subunit